MLSKDVNNLSPLLSVKFIFSKRCFGQVARTSFETGRRENSDFPGRSPLTLIRVSSGLNPFKFLVFQLRFIATI